MCLNVATSLLCIILELAFGILKGIANGNVEILMCLLCWRLTIDD
jgi:hypothetical protein